MSDEAGHQHYLGTIARFGRLDPVSERDLANRWIASRDPAAARGLVEAHLRFVAKVARGFSGYGLPIDDLVAEGNMGLLEAVERFDPERNVRFISYAVFWIRAFMLAYIQRHASLVRRPLSSERTKLFFRLARERARVQAALGHIASAEEIERIVGQQLGTTGERVREVSATLDHRDLSLDAPATQDGPTNLLSLLREDGESADERVAREERERIVHELLETIGPALSQRERYIVRHRLYTDEPETLFEISRRFGLSRERVRQIEEQLKRKLRAGLTALAPELRAA